MMVPASLPRRTTALLALLTAATTRAQPAPPRMTISPLTPKLLLLQNSTISCTSKDPDVAARGIVWTVRCLAECPEYRLESLTADDVSHSYFHFVSSAPWNGSTITCYEYGLPNSSLSVNVLVFGAPKLTIFPNVSSYFLSTFSRITCQMEDAEEVDVYFREALVLLLSCPHGNSSYETDRQYQSNRFYEGGALGLEISFLATTDFNECIFTCTLSNNLDIAVSQKIRIIGEGLLEMRPNPLRFVEHELATVSCSIVDTEAIEQAAQLNIQWSSSCIGGCQPPAETPQSGSPVEKFLTFRATRSWQSATLRCSSMSYPWLHVTETVAILPPPGALMIYTDEPLFLIGHTALVHCAMNTSGATTDLQIRVLDCEICRPTNDTVHGAVRTIEFLPNSSWNGSTFLCYKSLDESQKITFAVVVHGVPTLSILPSSAGLLPYGAETTLKCVGDGVTGRLDLMWNVTCLWNVDCPAYSERKDGTGHISMTFIAHRKWSGAQVKCSLQQFPAVKGWRSLAVLGGPNLTISPNISSFFSSTEVKLECKGKSIEGDHDWLRWKLSCPHVAPSLCSGHVENRYDAEGVSHLTISFKASTFWNESVIECGSAYHRLLTRVSKKIYIIGKESLQMLPSSLRFVEHSEVMVSCALVGSEAVKRAADLNIDWMLRCSGACPPHDVTPGFKGPPAKLLSFNATRKWQSAQARCYSSSHPAFSITETVTILVPPGELMLHTDKPLFLSGHTALVHCSMNASGVTTELLFRVLKCDTCHPRNDTSRGSVRTFEFVPDPSWNGSELVCYKSMNESQKVTLDVIVHAIPRLKISPDGGAVFFDTETTLKCRGDGVTSLLGLEWNITCRSECPSSSAQSDESTGDISLTFVSNRRWNDAVLTCSLRQFPTVARSLRLAVVDAPTVKIFPKNQFFDLDSVVVLFCTASTSIAPADLHWVTHCTYCGEKPAQYIAERDGVAARALKFTAIYSWHNVTARCYSIDYPQLEDAITILLREAATDDESPLLYVVIGLVAAGMVFLVLLIFALLKWSTMFGHAAVECADTDAKEEEPQQESGRPLCCSN